MTKIIGLSGKMGSGKTEFAKIANEKFKITKLSFADGLKREIAAFLYIANVEHEASNFYGTQEEKNRELKIKTSFLEIEHKNFIKNFAISNINGVTTFRPRDLMQYWGTEYRRDENNNYWINKLHTKLKALNEKFVIIDDVRFLNECEWVKQNEGIVVRINRETGKNNNKSIYHPSEVDLDNYQGFDITVNNNSNLADYQKQVISILEKIVKGQ